MNESGPTSFLTTSHPSRREDPFEAMPHTGARRARWQAWQLPLHASQRVLLGWLPGLLSCTLLGLLLGLPLRLLPCFLPCLLAWLFASFYTCFVACLFAFFLACFADLLACFFCLLACSFACFVLCLLLQLLRANAAIGHAMSSQHEPHAPGAHQPQLDQALLNLEGCLSCSSVHFLAGLPTGDPGSSLTRVERPAENMHFPGTSPAGGTALALSALHATKKLVVGAKPHVGTLRLEQELTANLSIEHNRHAAREVDTYKLPTSDCNTGCSSQEPLTIRWKLFGERRSRPGFARTACASNTLVTPAWQAHRRSSHACSETEPALLSELARLRNPSSPHLCKRLTKHPWLHAVVVVGASTLGGCCRRLP